MMGVNNDEWRVSVVAIQVRLNSILTQINGGHLFRNVLIDEGDTEREQRCSARAM